MRNVVLFSGDGGVGKTVLLMQLAATTVLLDKTWLGMRPAVGPVLYLGAEDDRAELRRRFDSIAKHYGVTWEDLFDAGLRTRSFAGLDALLGKPDRDGVIVATPLFARIRQDVIALRPRLFIIDPAADVYAGNEINRAQVRQFITMLRGIAIKKVHRAAKRARSSRPRQKRSLRSSLRSLLRRLHTPLQTPLQTWFRRLQTTCPRTPPYTPTTV